MTYLYKLYRFAFLCFLSLVTVVVQLTRAHEQTGTTAPNANESLKLTTCVERKYSDLSNFEENDKKLKYFYLSLLS